jgi:hypothetical protein
MNAQDYDPSNPLRDRRRERFCRELMAGTPLYDAYVEAGFARPRGNAQRMEQEPEVAARLEYLRMQVEKYEPFLLAFRRVLVRRKLDNIVDLDRLGLFEECCARGKRTLRLKPIEQLTPEQRALIEGIEVARDGRPLPVMPSKLAALAQLREMDGFRAPAKVENTITDNRDQRYTDIELARWIAAKLEDGARAQEAISMADENDGNPPRDGAP